MSIQPNVLSTVAKTVLLFGPKSKNFGAAKVKSKAI